MTPDCARTLDQLDRREADREPALWQHLRDCPSCAAAAAAHRDVAAAGAAPHPPADATLARIRDRARGELSASRPATPWRRQALWVALTYLAIGVVGGVVTGLRWSQLRGTSALDLWSVGAVLVAVLTLGVFLGIAPRRRAMLGAFLPAAAAGGLLLVFGGSAVPTGRPFLAEGLPCLTTEVAMSLLPLAIAGWVLVHTAFDAGRAVALGLAAAATGLLSLHLHCAQGAWTHLAVFHLAPAALLALALVAVRRALPTRSYAP